MKLYLVQGLHHNVPSVARTAHFTAAQADARALELVNLLRADTPRDGFDSDEQTPSLPALPAGADWRAGLAECRRCYASHILSIPLAQMGGVVIDEEIDETGTVWIEELDVQDVPAGPVVIEDVLASADTVAGLLEEALDVHIYDVGDDRSADPYVPAIQQLRDALQMMRLAALWQSLPAEPVPVYRTLQPADLANVQGIDIKGPGDAVLTYESAPDEGFAFPLRPIRVAVNVTGGVVQWALADRPGVEVNVLDFDLEDHDGDNLKLVTDSDTNIGPAHTYIEEAGVDPAYFDRLALAPDCDAEGDLATHYSVGDPHKWMATGSVTTVSGEERFAYFVEARNISEASAKANAMVAAEYPGGKAGGVTLRPPVAEKGA